MKNNNFCKRVVSIVSFLNLYNNLNVFERYSLYTLMRREDINKYVYIWYEEPNISDKLYILLSTACN